MCKRYFSFLLLGLMLAECNAPTTTPIDYDEIGERDRHELRHALASMEVMDGLEVELFASEPMMINPTNMDIDHKGRIWICEARNYRLKFNQSHKARPEGDRILILEDMDGDGKADKSTVFYQGEEINAALGIAVLGNKVVVSASPHVFVFYDDNGDDRADRKEVLFSGLSGMDDDHGVHAFTFGPDGRLYFNFGNAGKRLGDSEGNIINDIYGRPIETSGTPFRQGLTFRCEEDGSDVEVLGNNFRNIYEVAVDAFGNLIQSDNDDDGNEGVRINYIIEGGNYGYRDQVTGAGWRARRVNMHEEIPKRHWHLNDPGVIPNTLQTGSGSPTGITFYEGNLLPPLLHGQVIHGEPGHQVVRAYLLQEEGAGYTATIKNILRSKDKWFRPSDVCIAPDGSLFVSDWYDAVVGGNGMDDVRQGRIYRIAPNADKYVFQEADFSTAAGAAAALSSPNMSTRYLAWHRLLDLGDQAVQELNHVIEKGDSRSKARALWLLARFDGHTASAISRALSDADVQIQLTGIRMARYHRRSDISAFLQEQELALESAAIRREIALSLQHDCSESAVSLWTRLASYYEGHDRWELEILGLATDACPDIYFERWIRSEVRNQDAQNDLIWRIRSTLSRDYIYRILEDSKIAYGEKRRYLRALHFKPGTTPLNLYSELLRHHKEEAAQDILLLINQNALASNPNLKSQLIKHLPKLVNTPEWFSAVTELNLVDERTTLWSNMQSHPDRSVQASSANALIALGQEAWLKLRLTESSMEEYHDIIALLGGNGTSSVIAFLAQELSRNDLDLATQKSIISALGNSWDGQHLLDELITKDKISDDLKLSAAVKLMNSWNSDLRNKAPKILAALDRSAFAESPDVVGLSRKTGDAKVGASVFQQHCSNCHQIKGIGLRFGPDLSGVGAKLSKRGLYQAIIFPSAAINFGYEGMQLETVAGEHYQGYVESETEDELLLRLQVGETRSFSRTELKQVVPMTHSLMTQGLHQMMSQEELVDLVEYLTQQEEGEKDSI